MIERLSAGFTMDNANCLPKLLDVRRAAELIGVKPCTIRRERLRGHLGFIKIGARIFYTEKLIKEYLEKQKVPACASGPEFQSQGKLEITGSASIQAAKARTMRGTEHGTTKEAARLAEQALAQQIFRRRAAR